MWAFSGGDGDVPLSVHRARFEGIHIGRSPAEEPQVDTAYRHPISPRGRSPERRGASKERQREHSPARTESDYGASDDDYDAKGEGKPMRYEPDLDQDWLAADPSDAEEDTELKQVPADEGWAFFEWSGKRKHTNAGPWGAFGLQWPYTVDSVSDEKSYEWDESTRRVNDMNKHLRNVRAYKLPPPTRKKDTGFVVPLSEDAIASWRKWLAWFVAHPGWSGNHDSKYVTFYSRARARAAQASLDLGEMIPVAAFQAILREEKAAFAERSHARHARLHEANRAERARRYTLWRNKRMRNAKGKAKPDVSDAAWKADINAYS